MFFHLYAGKHFFFLLDGCIMFVDYIDVRPNFERTTMISVLFLVLPPVSTQRKDFQLAFF